MKENKRIEFKMNSFCKMHAETLFIKKYFDLIVEASKLCILFNIALMDNLLVVWSGSMFLGAEYLIPVPL